MHDFMFEPGTSCILICYIKMIKASLLKGGAKWSAATEVDRRSSKRLSI